jgi:hypothetical protein
MHLSRDPVSASVCIGLISVYSSNCDCNDQVTIAIYDYMYLYTSIGIC